MTAGAIVNRFWSRCSVRQRLLMGIAAAAVLLALVYSVTLGSGRIARQQLAARVPVMRAQVDDMQRQRQEILQLRKRLDAALQRPNVKSLLETSAERTSFARSVERIEGTVDGKVNVRMAPVVFDDWLAWTESLQRDFGVRIDTCRISALGQPGLVRIEATFASGLVSASQKP